MVILRNHHPLRNGLLTGAALCLVAVLCSMPRDNPLDTQNPDYVPPRILIDTTASTVHQGDTLVVDSFVVVYSGNLPQSLLAVQLDAGLWSEWSKTDTFTASGLANGSHVLRIRSFYNTGAGDTTSDSIVFFVLVADTIPPDRPANVRVSRVDTTHVRVTWSPAHKAAKYQVWSNPDRSIPDYSMSAEVTDTFAVHATRLDYWYYVVALDTAGNKAFSTDTVMRDTGPVDTTKPVIRLFDPPLDSTIIGANTKLVKVIATDASGMRSVRYTVNTDTFPATKTDSVWSANVLNLRVGYNTITITATDSSANRNVGIRQLRIKYDSTLVDTTRLTRPTNLRVSRVDTTHARITWSPARKAVKYQVWHNPDRNVQGYSMSAEVTDTLAVHTTRFDYWYYVIAFDAVGNKAFSTDTVKFVLPVKHAPNFTLTPGDHAIRTGVYDTLRLAATDADGDSLVFAFVNKDSIEARLANPHTLTWTTKGDSARLIFGPGTAQGSFALTFTVTDGDSTDTATIRILVSTGNLPPTWRHDSIEVKINAGERLTMSLPDSVSDEGPLTFSLLPGTPASDLIDSKDTTYVYQPSLAEVGAYIVRIVASDGEYTDTLVVRLSVVNVPPTIAASGGLLPSGTVEVKEGAVLNIAFTVRDDNPGDTARLLRTVGNAPWGDGKGTGSMDSVQRLFTYRPGFKVSTGTRNAQYQNVTIMAVDNGSPPQSAQFTFNITVLDSNSAPRWAHDSIAGLTARGGVQFSYDFATEYLGDNEGDTVDFAATFGTISGTRWQWTPTLRSRPDTVCVITATDRHAPPLSSVLRMRISIIDSNTPPSVSILNPANGAQGIARGAVFSWRGTDGDNDPLTYSIYLGTLSDQLELVKTTADTSSTLTALLSPGVVYYWKVTVSDGKATTSSATRSFKTNTAPTVNLAAPANGATGIALPVTFSWTGADADAGDNANLKYDLYVSSADSTPKKVFHDTSATSLTVQGLSYGKSYKWKVVAKDGKDSAASSEWQFTTVVPNARLSSLSLTGGPVLSPTFRSDLLLYGASITYADTNLTLVAVTQQQGASVRVNGQPVAGDGSIVLRKLNVGRDTIRVEVTAIDNATRSVYVIAFLRAAPAPFQKHYGGASDEFGLSFVQMPDGGYLLVGRSSSFISVVRTSPTGDTLWTRTYGPRSQNIGWCVQRTRDRCYVIAGSTRAAAEPDDMYLMKIDSSGVLLWEHSYGGSDFEEARDVKQTADGGFVLIGTTKSKGAGQEDMYIVKTDSAGNQVWDAAIGGTDSDYGYSIVATPSGYIALGKTYSGSGCTDLYLVGISTAGGRLWTKTYGGTGCDEGAYIAGNGTGEYVAVGQIGTGNLDGWILYMNANGDTVKTVTFGGASYDYATHISPTSDGGYIVAGTFYSADQDVLLLKLGANRQVQWQKIFGGSLADIGYGASETTDGGFAVIGSTLSFVNGGRDMYFVKTDAAGNSTTAP